MFKQKGAAGGYSSSKKKLLKKKLMVDRADHRRHLSFKKENKK